MRLPEKLTSEKLAAAWHIYADKLGRERSLTRGSKGEEERGVCLTIYRLGI